MAPQPTASQPVAASSVQLEVQEYLQQPALDRQKDPLIFWASQDTKYPHLAALEAKYLAFPATSAPVERLFSIEVKIFRPDWCHLPDTVFEQLMILRGNGHLM